MSIEFSGTIPTLRMFDVRKAKEFYRGFLGFSVDWEHRFEPNTRGSRLGRTHRNDWD